LVIGKTGVLLKRSGKVILNGYLKASDAKVDRKE